MVTQVPPEQIAQNVFTFLIAVLIASGGAVGLYAIAVYVWGKVMDSPNAARHAKSCAIACGACFVATPIVGVIQNIAVRAIQGAGG